MAKKATKSSSTSTKKEKSVKTLSKKSEVKVPKKAKVSKKLDDAHIKALPEKPDETLDATSEKTDKEVKKVKLAKEGIKVKKSKAESKAEESLAESSKKWLELKSKYSSEKAMAYSMTSKYEAQTPVQHKIFGWGYILNNDNDRLEVLFESGTRHLISNYKS